MPHKGLPSVALEEPSADEISAISPSSVDNEAGSSEFSALDGGGKGSEKIGDVQEGGSSSELGADGYAYRAPAPSDKKAVAADIERRKQQGALSYLTQRAAELDKMAWQARQEQYRARAEGLRERERAAKERADIYEQAAGQYHDAAAYVRENFPVHGHGINAGLAPFSFVQDLFNEFNSTTDNAYNTKRLMDLCRRLATEGNVVFEFVDGDLPNGRAAHYGKGRVRLDANYFNSVDVTDAEKAATILHDTLHSVVDMVFEPSVYARLDEVSRAAVDELRNIFEAIKRDPRYVGVYGRSDIREMVAELSNPAFCDMLKSRHPSVWQRIVDLLMDIVTLGGYSRNTNRYKRVRDAVETLLGRDTLGVDYRHKEAEPAVERESRDETEPETDDELPIEPAPEQHTEPEPTPAPEQGQSDLPWDNPEPTKPATPTETAPERPTTPEPAAPAQQSDIPMDEKGEPIWSEIEPERGYAFIVDSMRDTTVDGFIEGNTKRATKELEKHRKNPPQDKSSVYGYEQKEDALIKEIDFWNAVAKIRADVLAQREAEAKAKQEEERRKAEEERRKRIEAERAEREKREREEAERRAKLGINNVGDEVREKWNNTPKIEGATGSINVQGESISGRYYLVDADAPTPSHDPFSFESSAGFPVNERGENINDRDYENNSEYQKAVMDKGQTYDGRAVDNVPVVSKDGVVLSGNDRTMASQRAARNNSDGRYLQALRENASRFGFTEEQVNSMEHPRVVFVPDADMPYTSETMRKFNAGGGGKGETIGALASALSKTIKTATLEELSAIIDKEQFDRLSDISNDQNASQEIVKLLAKAGIITKDQSIGLLENGHLNGQGVDLLKAIVLGSVFDAETIGILDSTGEDGKALMADIKEKLIMAASHLVKNSTFGDYSLRHELQEAIKIVSGAKANEDSIDEFLARGNVFAGGRTANLYDVCAQLLAHVLHKRGTKELREVLSSYNKRAESAAHGNPTVMTDANGDMVMGIEPKEYILKDILNTYKYYEREESKQGPESRGDTGQGDNAGTGGDRDGGETPKPEVTSEGDGKTAPEVGAGGGDGGSAGVVERPARPALPDDMPQVKREEAERSMARYEGQAERGQALRLKNSLEFWKESLDENKKTLEYWQHRGAKDDTFARYRARIEACERNINYITALLEYVRAKEPTSSWNVRKGKGNDYSLDDLDALMQEHCRDEEMLALWNSVLVTSRKLGVDNIRFNSRLKSTMGEVMGGRIRFQYEYFNDADLTDREKSHTMLHELIHHATVYAFQNKEKLPPEMRRAVEDLEWVYNSIKRDPAFKGEYGLTSAMEMVAELSNPEFCEKLKKKNLWERVINGVLRLFGFAPNEGDARATNAYEAARRALDTLLANYDKAAYDDYAKYAKQYSPNFLPMSHDRAEFDATRERAIREKGIVMPGLSEMEVEVVPVHRHNFNGKQPLAQAEKWARENIVTKRDEQGKYIDMPRLADGTEYAISGKTIEKFLSESATSKTGNIRLHLSVLQKIIDVIGSSIEAEIHPSYKKGEDGKRQPDNGYNFNQLVHRLFGAITFEGKVYRVKTTLIEERGSHPNRPHSYEVSEIKLVGEESPTILAPTGQVHIGVAKLLQGVEKSYDSGKLLLDESGKTTETGSTRYSKADGEDVIHDAGLERAAVEGAVEHIKQTGVDVVTDEQRRQSLAVETEDVPRDEQIVQFGNGVSMNIVKDDILDYFHKAVRGEVTGHGRSVGKLTKEGKQYLEQLSGLTLKEDVDFILNPSDLRHIYNEHYGANEKDPGNNKPLTDEDIRNLANIVTQPERVIFGIDKKTGNKIFVFLSSNTDGTYNLAEVYTDRRGNLTTKSFYNTKKTISQRVNELLTNSPRLTSATEGASSSLPAKIPKLFESLQEKRASGGETTETGGRLADKYRSRSDEDLDSGEVPLNGKINPSDGDGKFRVIDDTAKRFTNWFGTTQQRYKGNVGKEMGGFVYVHKDYAGEIIPADVLAKAKAIAEREGFAYNCVMYKPKTPNVVRFDEAPDFDTAREPITGNYLTVDTTTGEVVRSKKPSTQIWHHKWMWVKDDYKGFDVQAAYEWSKEWSRRISNPDGLAYKWEYLLKRAGLPVDWNGSALAEGHGRLYRDDEDATGFGQTFGSAATSLNQRASAIGKIRWEPGTVNVDIGGGRFDKATEWLREQGVENLVFDPFNRGADHNRVVAERVRAQGGDTVTCTNVLNVIDSAAARDNVILQAAKALKSGGTAYFSVYEGDKSGVGRQSSRDAWQNNRRLRDYLPEIERRFNDVQIKGGMIIARDPKPTADKSLWDYDGTYSGNNLLFRERQWKAGDVLDVEHVRTEQGEPRVSVDYTTGERTETTTDNRNYYRVPGLEGEYRSLDELCWALRSHDYEHVFVPSEDGKHIEVHHWTENEILRIMRGMPGSKRFERFVERAREQSRKSLDKFANQLGVSVRVVESLDGLTGRDRDAKGWFDPETGEIVVVLPNHDFTTDGDVLATLWHEAVGHYGLRKMCGEAFDLFLYNVYNNVEDNIRADIDQLMRDKGLDRGTATEEYLSRLAEQEGFEHYKNGANGVFARVWEVVERFFDQMLVKAGIRLPKKMGTNELRYLMWRSYNNLLRTRGSVADTARDITMQRNLRVGNYGETLSDKVAAARDRLYRDDERKPTFYSNAERAVENVKQGKATGEQWLNMLRKAGGIKSGEDKWMGLSDWLNERKGETLTKEQVLQFVRDNGVKMVEREYIEAPYSFESLKREYDQWLHDEGFDYAQEQLRERFGDDADIAFDDLGGELVIANEEAAAALLGSEDIINSTRLDYTTEGLDNKREIAFVVPGVEPYQEYDEVHFGPENGGRAVMWVRFGETRTSDGKRVLVIDEIQSNRHQDARDKGYMLAPRWRAAYEQLRKRHNDLMHAYYERAAEWANAGGSFEDAYKEDAVAKSLREQWDAAGREMVTFMEEHGGSGSSTVPAAPFEKNWHEVAMKRMLRLAAEEGYDYVAWTTGEQQAKRYDLSKVLDEIAYWKEGDNTWGISAGDADNPTKIDQESYSEAELRVTFGDEIAERIMRDEGVTESVLGYPADENARYINGERMRIGGEGMKGFYDRMLPQFMDKYGKKWGVKTADVELALPNGGDRVMHGVEVNDAMRDSVMQGQPMFMLRGDNNGSTKNVELKRAILSTANTIIHKPTDASVSQLYHDYKSNVAGWRQRMIDWIVSIVPSTMRTVVGEVQFSRGSARNAMAHGKGDLKMLITPYIEQMLQDGILFNVNKDSEYTYYNIAHRLQYEGDNYVARFVIREDKNGKRYYDHEFTEINKVDELPTAQGRTTKSEHLTHQPAAKLLKEILATKDNGNNILPNGGSIAETERIIGELNARYGGRMRGVRSDELPPHLRENLANDAVAVFDPSTGNTYVLTDRVVDANDAVRSWWHEEIGHKGIREILGEHYGTWLQRVWDGMSKAERDEMEARYRAEWERVEDKKGTTLEQYIADEWVARVAEGGVKDLGTWRKLRGWLQKFILDKFGIVLGKADIDYMIWKAAKTRSESVVNKAMEATLRRNFDAAQENRIQDIQARLQDEANRMEARDKMQQNIASRLTEMDAKIDELEESWSKALDIYNKAMSGRALDAADVAELGVNPRKKITPAAIKAIVDEREQKLNTAQNRRGQVADAAQEWDNNPDMGNYRDPEQVLRYWSNNAQETKGEILTAISEAQMKLDELRALGKDDKGLREIIGEAGMSEFLREVYAHVKADVRRHIAKHAEMKEKREVGSLGNRPHAWSLSRLNFTQV